MILYPFSLGNTLEILSHRVHATVVVGRVEQRMFYLPGLKQNFVFSQPGQPFQLEFEIKEAEVELLVFDGTATYTDVNQLVVSGLPGNVYMTRGTHTVEQMVRAGSLTPLVFGPGSGIVAVKLFSQRYDLDRPRGAEYERGHEIGGAIIHYGQEFPTSSRNLQRIP